MASWSFGLAIFIGLVGMVVGLTFGGTSSSGGGFLTPALAVNNWPGGIAISVGALFCGFLLACVGTLLNWAAAVYEALPREVAKDADGVAG
jgi:hypothetical protein